MHCEVDSGNNSWGLLGLHLVQKTQNHGEFIWASFEHVANSPDCNPGGSNPIQQNPVDPINPGLTINVNSNISGLAKATGWSLFNWTLYPIVSLEDAILEPT